MWGKRGQIYFHPQEAKETEIGSLAALQGVKAGLTGYQAYQAYQQEAMKPADEQSFAGISISLGSQQSESQSSLKQSNSKGSTLTAGQNVTLTATGTGAKDADGYAADGNIGVAGSSIKGQDITLDAARDITLEATRNTSEQTGSNSSSGGNVGVSLGVGQGAGFTIFANANKAKGHENGDGNFWNESVLTAGQTLTLQSGRDTTLSGAQASGDTVLADVGRNLTLTSLQDHDHYDSQQTSSSAGASFTFGSMTGSGYVNVSRDKIRSDFDSVQQQTGLYAGKGGFDVYVGEHTQLNGAVIASTSDADKNSLSTSTLGFENLHNVADFEVKHEGISMSGGGSFTQSATTTLISQGASTVLGGGNSSGHAESTTYAAVSAGSIEIRDKDKQQQDVATLSRDTEHSANGLSPIFDKQKELDRLKESQLIGEIGAQATQIVITQMSMPVREKEAEAAKAEKAGDAVGAARLKAEAAALDKDIQAQWGMGSDFQRAAQAVTAALQGLAGGNMGAAISGAAAPYLAGIVKDMTSGSPTANVMAHAVLGAALAQASGGNAAAGAAGGAIAPIAAKLITDALYPGRDVSTLTETEKQTVSALTTLAGGLAGSVAGDTLAGAQTAKNEVENNTLAAKQMLDGAKAVGGCLINLSATCLKQESGKLVELDRKQSLAMQRGGEKALEERLQGIKDLPDSIKNLAYYIADNPEEAAIMLGKAIAQLPGNLYSEYKEKLNNIGTALLSGGVDAFEKAGHDLTNLAIDIGAGVATGGAVKAGGKLTEAIVGRLDSTLKAEISAAKITNNFYKDADFFTAVNNEMNVAKNAGWKKADGKTWWPPENGIVPGTAEKAVLQVGERLDRYGGTSKFSSFLAPSNTPIGMRALSPETDLLIHDVYMVLKPFPVEQSRVMPWFGKEGMGMQFETKSGTGMTIEQLVNRGYLGKVK